MIATHTTHHQSLQERFTLSRGPLRTWRPFISPAHVPRIAFEPLLIGQILLPGDVGRIDILLELKPLLSWFAYLNRAVAAHLASWVTWPSPIDKGSCIRRVLKHLVNGSL